jgi:HAD superfamily hydrolase (TIGR01549 family)
MIKAYFFDWMKTLGSYEDVINFKENLTPEEFQLLLITKEFSNLNLVGEKKELIYNALHKTKLNLYPDSEETIKELKKRDIKLAILSNAYCITPSLIRDLFPDFLKNFDVVTFSSEVGMRKPDKSIFTLTLNKLNEVVGEEILPEEILMIGDDEKQDIAPALSLGMQAKLIDRTKQTLIDII